MSHRAGLPAQRIHRGAYQTVTVAHLIATNAHFYAIGAKMTFRRDELSLPPGLRDRTHRSTRPVHHREVIGTTADTAANNAALTIPTARFTGAADELIALFARFTAAP